MWVLIVIALHGAGMTETRYPMPDYDTCATARAGTVMTKSGTGQFLVFCVPETTKR